MAANKQTIRVRIVETGDMFPSIRAAELWIREKVGLRQVGQAGPALQKAMTAARAFSGYTAEFVDGDSADHDPKRFRRVAKHLGIRAKTDWYAIQWQHFNQTPEGATVLGQNGNSLLKVLRRYIPEVEWTEWLFPNAPHGFWADKENRMRYMEWLCNQLGYDRPSQVCRLQYADFKANHGEYMLTRNYASAPWKVVIEYLEWCESQA